MKNDKPPTDLKLAYKQVAAWILEQNPMFLSRRARLELGSAGVGDTYKFLSFEFQVAFGISATICISTGIPEGVTSDDMRFNLAVTVNWPTSNYSVTEAAAAVALHRQVVDFALLLSAYVDDSFNRYGVR